MKPIWARMRKLEKQAYSRALVASHQNIVAGIDGVTTLLETEIAVRDQQITKSRAAAGLKPCDNRQVQLFTSYTHGMPRDAFLKVFVLRYLQASDAAYPILNSSGPVDRNDVASLLSREKPQDRKVFASSERAHLVMIEHINIVSGSERDSVGNTDSYKLAIGFLNRLARESVSGPHATVTAKHANLFEAFDPLNVQLIRK